jgi:ABC-type glycerol-3-phosphate transport system permease component
VVLAVGTFFPYLFLFITSTKPLSEFYRNFWLPVWPPHWANYIEAWNAIDRYLLNSILVSGASTLLSLAGALPTAYVFARFSFPGKRLLFGLLLSLMLVPAILTLVPAFHLVRQMGLLDTLWVMILPYGIGGQVFAVFILRSFFASIEPAIFASARVDGAGEVRTFLHIALPLSKHAVGAVAILLTLGSWNNFIWPLVTISSNDRSVITRGLYVFTTNMDAPQYGEMFAAYLLSSLPLLILFLLTSRLFLQGIGSGAIK